MSTFKNLPDYQILPLLQPNLDEKPFDMERVKTICARGLSKCPLEDRALAWLALLSVFPSVPNKWNEKLLFEKTIQEKKKESFFSYTINTNNFQINKSLSFFLMISITC